MRNIKYTGCFFNYEELHRELEKFDWKRLHETIADPHVTFSYRPDSVPDEFFGTRVTFRVVGYGRNEENEALAVEFTNLPEAMLGLTESIELPHITLSISETGESVNSRYLDFQPITPFLLSGIFGAMDESGEVYLQ